MIKRVLTGILFYSVAAFALPITNVSYEAVVRAGAETPVNQSSSAMPSASNYSVNREGKIAAQGWFDSQETATMASLSYSNSFVCYEDDYPGVSGSAMLTMQFDVTEATSFSIESTFEPLSGATEEMGTMVWLRDLTTGDCILEFGGMGYGYKQESYSGSLTAGHSYEFFSSTYNVNDPYLYMDMTGAQQRIDLVIGVPEPALSGLLACGLCWCGLVGYRRFKAGKKT